MVLVNVKVAKGITRKLYKLKSGKLFVQHLLNGKIISEGLVDNSTKQVA